MHSLQNFHRLRDEAVFAIALRYLALEENARTCLEDRFMFLEYAGENDNLDGARKIGNGDECHFFAALREDGMHEIDHAANYCIYTAQVFTRVCNRILLVVEFGAMFVERMTRNVQTEKFFFPCETLVGGRW